MQKIRIEELQEKNFSSFRIYLKKHLSENGDNDVFFLPLTQEQSKFSPEWEDKFKIGLNKKIGETGWRKLWLAINEDNTIVGHVDIRSRSELNTEHRVMLGMGTDLDFRNRKIGQQLLIYIIEHCKKQSTMSWLDLEVMGSNTPAITMYEKMGFQLLSSIPDMFRFNNQSYEYKSMTLKVKSNG